MPAFRTLQMDDIQKMLNKPYKCAAHFPLSRGPSADDQLNK